LEWKVLSRPDITLALVEQETAGAPEGKRKAMPIGGSWDLTQNNLSGVLEEQTIKKKRRKDR